MNAVLGNVPTGAHSCHIHHHSILIRSECGTLRGLLALIDENFVYPKLKLHEKVLTHPFYDGKFLLPMPFLFSANPSVNNKRPLILRSRTMELNDCVPV